ncbi:hypothetical protein ACIXQX_23350 [Bacteroides fragilis]
MNYLNYALEKQKNNSDIEIFGGVSLELIKSVEQQLDIVFQKNIKHSYWSVVRVVSMIHTFLDFLKNGIILHQQVAHYMIH